MVRRPLSARASVGVAAHVVAARRERAVQGLELVGHGAPRPRARRGPQAPAQVAVGHQAAELRGERLDVVGLEEQPGLAVGQQLLVDRQARRDRHRAGGLARARSAPARARRRRRRRRGCRRRASASCASSTKRTRSSRSARSGVEDDGPRSECTTASHGSAGSSRRSARRNTRSAPRSSSSRKAMRTRPSSARGGRGSGVGAGRDDRVVAREEAAQQLRGRPVRGGARVEAPEDELHDLARDLGGHDALGRRVEGADVERARMAQRGAGHAGGERLVHVAEVERRRARRARRSCARRRSAAPRGAGRAAGAAPRRRRGRAPRRAPARARRAHRLARVAHERA